MSPSDASATYAPVGLFYGSSTCYTEIVAEKITAVLNKEQHLVDLFNIADEPISTMNHYPRLLLGIPTWDYGELQEDWENIWVELDSINFTGKQVALFGIGDQVGYPEWFLDALGYLHAKVKSLGAETCGFWPVDGYQFEQSKALINDAESGTLFVGLAIDDENQFELTDQRIQQWCDQIIAEFSLADLSQ